MPEELTLPELPDEVILRILTSTHIPEPPYIVSGFTATQMRDYGLACYRAGMERAAVICENHPFPPVSGSHNDGYGEALDDCARAIRKGE